MATLRALIEIAQHCMELRNFAGVFQIVCGLSLAPTMRLTRTWAGLSSKTQNVWNDLVAFVYPSEDHKVRPGLSDRE